MAHEYGPVQQDLGKTRFTNLVRLIVPIAGAVAGYTQRGLIYGAVPGLILASIVNYLIAHIIRKKLGQKPRAALGLRIGVLISIVVVVVVVLWPPSPQDIMQYYIMDSAVAMKNPQVFYCWERDPTYALKFGCDEVELDRIIHAVNGRTDSPARTAREGLSHYMRGDIENPVSIAPEWWNIEGITNPQTWRGKSRAGPIVRIRYDSENEQVFLEVLFL